jgi:hypothetical protein
MKSAFERAMERAEALGKASEEDLRQWKYLPEGETLAARYLKGEANLIAELSQYDDSARKYVIAGAKAILLRGIDLPRNEHTKLANRKAMEGIKALKKDNVLVENVYTKIRRLFNHYEKEGEEQRRRAYEDLRMDFEQRMQKALQQRTGNLGTMRVNVEGQPQFREEWRKLLVQLDSQYYKLLDECKQELLTIP